MSVKTKAVWKERRKKESMTKPEIKEQNEDEAPQISLLTRKCWKACILCKKGSKILVQSGCSGSGGTGDSVSI